MVVDVHSHIYPRAFLDELSKRQNVPKVEIRADGEHLVLFEREEELLGGTRPMSKSYYDLSAKIDFMNSHGIDKSVISIGNPWVDLFSPEDAVVWATRLNDWLQRECEQERRFLAFGVLPMQSPEAALAEINRLSKLPHVHGVIIGTRPGGNQLDHLLLEPIWAALEEYQMTVFIHPHYVVGYDWMAGFGHALPLALGFTFETTVAISRLILSGTFDRFPRLRVLLAHGGGALPYLAGRLAKCTRVDNESSRNIMKPLETYLSHLRHDTVLYSADALRFALSMSDSSHFAFGTDHPFGIADPALIQDAINQVASETKESEDMLGQNALRWFEVQ